MTSVKRGLFISLVLAKNSERIDTEIMSVDAQATQLSESELFARFEDGLGIARHIKYLDFNVAAAQAELDERLSGLDSLEGQDAGSSELAYRSLAVNLALKKANEEKDKLAQLREESVADFAGRLVTVRALDRTNPPITEYFAGGNPPDVWIPRMFQTSNIKGKVTGYIDDFLFDKAELRVKPRKRSIIRRMDQGYWDVGIFDRFGNTLVDVNFR